MKKPHTPSQPTPCDAGDTKKLHRSIAPKQHETKHTNQQPADQQVIGSTRPHPDPRNQFARPHAREPQPEARTFHHTLMIHSRGSFAHQTPTTYRRHNLRSELIQLKQSHRSPNANQALSFRHHTLTKSQLKRSQLVRPTAESAPPPVVHPIEPTPSNSLPAEPRRNHHSAARLPS